MDIFDRIAQTLENRVRSGIGTPYFSSAKYRTHEFSTANFKPIEAGEERLIAFIDGGNSPILEGPGISVQLNRVALGLFRGGQRVQSEMPSRIEFFSVMTMNPEEEICRFQLHPMREEYLEFLPDEDDMHLELKETDTIDEPTLKGLPRRFAEWSMALGALDELDAGDVLVRDGSLQASFEKENNYINELGDRAGDIHVVGLSKTCTLYTTTSISLLSAIGRLASEGDVKGTWCYDPIAIRTDRPTILAAVKLNPAGRIFRMDILGDYEAYKALEVASALSLNAGDACFPGYPYGLVDVDMRARVSGDEVEIYRRRVLSQIRDGEVLKGIKYETESLDYHDTLNRYAGEY
ncbi:DNA double-strand break repair nuclease NurA [Methanothermobacter sp.]|uniref:DNA double-strand break repair nuclease NurA n=1 Tax=Methanothermobacter sp. TaxID=1884223 RepID=UPI00263822F7|nr:DNA double-strand break repair nuclease NurA [Methanothermobacter sp.]MDI9617498.1 DNA double-strand break repair nuclease NurA [Methanothermobacter sp.]